MCHSCTQSLCSAFFFLLLSSHLRFSRLLLVIDNISFAVAPAVCSGQVFSLSSLLSYQLPFSESRGRDNKGPLFLSLASYFPFRQHTFSVHYLRTSLYLSVPLCTSGRDTIAHTRCPGVSVLLQSRVMTQFFSPLPLATFSPLQLHSTPAQRTCTAHLDSTTSRHKHPGPTYVLGFQSQFSWGSFELSIFPIGIIYRVANHTSGNSYMLNLVLQLEMTLILSHTHPIPYQTLVVDFIYPLLLVDALY